MSDYLTMAELENSTLKDIYAYAKEFKIPYYSQMNKKELSLAVIRAQAEKQGFFFMEGILDIVSQDGYGFLRPINYGPSAEDIYISSSQIRRFGLRNGDKVVARRVRQRNQNVTMDSCMLKVSMGKILKKRKSGHIFQR
ncbi:Rho termination factor N-terminal domain-containing protein [Enterococcus faecalis]